MRRRAAIRREILPDLRYHSKLVSKFINIVMERGKKSTAQGIVYQALEIVRQKTEKKDVLEVLQKAIDNVRPLLEVKSRRVGGATYQVPIEVKPERGAVLALRWLKDFARARKGRTMAERLCVEILDAYKGEGGAIKKREDMHKMAEANKAFSHYRW
jgi:small subunit ribosomal protein S7